MENCWYGELLHGMRSCWNGKWDVNMIYIGMVLSNYNSSTGVWHYIQISRERSASFFEILHYIYIINGQNVFGMGKLVILGILLPIRKIRPIAYKLSENGLPDLPAVKT